MTERKLFFRTNVIMNGKTYEGAISSDRITKEQWEGIFQEMKSIAENPSHLWVTLRTGEKLIVPKAAFAHVLIQTFPCDEYGRPQEF